MMIASRTMIHQSTISMLTVFRL
uniref:Uncharacterized protein n=1 Tax=Arundo donax TaxID=35708 RepID=A0A0A9BT78_ARUDO